MRSPTKRGVSTKPSSNCPKPKTNPTINAAFQAANCSNPATKANTNPTPNPK